MTAACEVALTTNSTTSMIVVMIVRTIRNDSEIEATLLAGC